MREIKFRVWNSKDKRFIYSDEFNYDGLNIKLFYFFLYVTDKEDFEKIEFSELQQYTGLKDRNGNEIFESDIIKLDDLFAKHICADRLICLVGFNEGSFMYGRDGNYNYMNSYLWMAENYCTVVGNTYQNPELLENNK